MIHWNNLYSESVGGINTATFIEHLLNALILLNAVNTSSHLMVMAII